MRGARWMGEARSEKRGSASSSRDDSPTKKRAGVGAKKEASGGAGLAKTESREDAIRGRGVNFAD